MQILQIFYALESMMAELEIIVDQSIQGDGVINEDLIGFTECAAWVLDGATGVGGALLPGPSDAYWLVKQFDRRFRQAYQRSPLQPTLDLLADAVAQVGRDFAQTARHPPTAPHELPSAAFAMVRVREDCIELTGLGDCGVAYRDGEDIAWFGADDIAPIERQILGELDHLRRTHLALADDEIKKLLLPALQNARRRMNQPAGYWVLSPDLDALDKLTTLVIPGDRFDGALMSDGMSRLTYLFNLTSLTDFLAVENAADATSLQQKLRTAEADDSACLKFPRVKCRDDASLLRVRSRRL